MHKEPPYQPPTTSRDAGPRDVASLTDSSAPSERLSLPQGILLIAGVNLIGFVASFFNTSQDSLMFTVLLFANLLLALGLMLRLEVARKALVGTAIITIGLSIASLIALAGYQHRMHQATARYEKAMGQVNPTQLTTLQKQQMKTYQQNMTELRQKAGRALGYTYTLLGVYIVESGVAAVYLTRPSVRAVFVTARRR